MIKILLSGENSNFSPAFLSGLKNESSVEIEAVETGKLTFEAISKTKADLVIVCESLPDMSGIEMIEELVKINPFVNTAIVSGLSEEDFHEATEGLGVLMPVPPDADEAYAVKLLDYLKQIVG